MITSIRSVLSSISPRRRKWLQFLAGLELDPEALERPSEQPTERDFIICGASRTGTSLLSAALFQPPAAVTVMEPWDGMRLPPAELFRSLRTEVEQKGELRRGRLDLDALADGNVQWIREGTQTIEVKLEPGFALGVKWPIYWRFLEYLPDTKFLVCVRHPLAVVQSFERVGGRLAEGLDYDTRFNRRMNTELESQADDAAMRRILLLEYVSARILPHIDRPNVMTVRYERWGEDAGGLMSDISAFLGVELGPPPIEISPIRTAPVDRGLADQIRTLAPSALRLGYDI